MKANLTRMVPVTTAEAVGLLHHFNGFLNDTGFTL